MKQQRWLILDPQTDGSNKTYRIEQSPDATELSIYQAENPFLLINWAASYSNDVEVSLLNLAASLAATVPVVSKDNPQDIDGRYEGEFPDLSWKNATSNLQEAVDKLKEYEGKYEAALKEQINGNRTDEIINLLKQPLLLNTADYREQMVAAIAEVREAEVDLEVAEFESLATQFEVFANQMLYEAADVEVQRQSTLVEVSKLDEEISDLERKADGIRKSQASTSVDIAKRDVDLAKNVRAKALKESEKVKIARKAILREIDLLKSLLEKPTKITIDGRNITANGQIGAMAYKVEATLIKQLNENLATARIELQKAQDAEAERKKREKRRRLVSGICRFVGAVVGSIYGGPAGAALGAEIGGAIGELANGVIENKAPEEILVGLVDNGFAIAQAAGVDLEKELNTLGSKGATQLNQFFDQLDSTLEPLLDNLPKILDEQLVKDTIIVLDLPEVPILTDLLEKSYKDLKKSIPNLGQLGTALKVIQYDSPRQFLEQLGDNLFKNTRDNAEGIKALSQVIGKKVEDLQTEEGRKEAAERFAKLVVTKVGQEAPNFRQDAIATWIRNKRDKAQWWNAVVQKEAEDLVKDLFPDVRSQGEVMANLESSLINPEIIRGELQVHLDPWQKELDKRIGEITAAKDTSPPQSAVDAAQQSVTYLETCIKKFNDSLLPWLKGDGNTQRTQLLLDLNKLQTEKFPTSDIDLQIGEINEANALLSEGNAKDALANMEKELKRVGLLYEAADLKVSKAALLNKVADLAKLSAENLKGAKENSLKASEKRQQAAQAKVKSAQFNLEAKKALAQGAARRGTEASRIRGTLSQPALRLPNLTANSTSRLREDYVEQLLKFAFKAYRELLRYYYAAFSVVDPSLQKIPILPKKGSWSKNFTDWQQYVGDNFSSPNDPSQASDNLEWDLTPQQIKSLFSPEGFRLVIAPHVEERPVLFSVPQEWQIYLDQLNRLNGNIDEDEKRLIEQLWRPGFNQLWIREFRKNGILISEQVSIKTEDSENWRIEDLETEPIKIAFIPEGSTLPVRWNIKRSISYSVAKDADRLFVTLRPLPEDVGQSDFGDRHFKNINASEAKTGRVAAIFLTGKVRGSSGVFLKETDYSIVATHLGDIWTTDSATKVKVQLRKQRTLQDQRDFFVPLGINLITHLNESKAFFTGQGDPDIFGVQGNPLSGTTVIKLKPKGGAAPPFESLKLQVLYTFWT